MSTLQPFMQTASMIARVFAMRLKNCEEFSQIKADINDRLHEIFVNKPAFETNILQKAYDLMFAEENLEMFKKMVVLIVKYKNLATALLNYFDDVEKAEYALEKAHQGGFPDKLMFTHWYVVKFGPIPGELGAYIDHEQLAQDLFMDKFYAIEVGGRTHVFKRDES